VNPRGRKWQEAGEDSIMRNFITCRVKFTICMLHQILLGSSSERE